MPGQLETTIDLLISQWQGAPKIQALIEVVGDIATDDLLPALQTLRLMRLIESSQGIHLDYLGRRLGVQRPSTVDRAQDPRFGFESAGQGFDQVPFAGDRANDAVFPLPDAVFRQFLRARSIALLSDGTVTALALSIRAIDPSASVSDRRNMTVRVVTTRQSLLELADESGCLARNAGIGLIFADRGRFGFDDAGVGYDQGPFSVG